MSLNKLLKKELAARSQTLKPVVILGNNGLTDAVALEITGALVAHELIKIRINASDNEERAQLTQAICERTQSELVKKIGHVISIYRKNPKKIVKK